MRHFLLRFLLVPFALFLLAEEWLWEKLGPLVRDLVALFPFLRLREWLVKVLTGLPPYVSLFVFLIPAAILLPLKLAGVYFLSQGHWLLALLALAVAKLLGMGVTAFLFHITKGQLLQIAWFAYLYQWILKALAWSHDLLAPIIKELKRSFRVLKSRKGLLRAFRLLFRIHKSKFKN